MFPLCHQSGAISECGKRMCRLNDDRRWVTLDTCLACPYAVAIADADLVPICSPPLVESQYCRHRGPVIRTLPCELCGATVAKGQQVPVYHCALHGECATIRFRQLGQPRICGTCEDFCDVRRAQFPDLTGPANLMMCIYPRAEAREIWKAQQERIRMAIGTFDGLKLCAVAYDDTTAEEEIDESLWDEVVRIPNDPAQWELPGWRWAMTRLKEQPGFTVRLHAKGVVRGICEQHTKRWWELGYDALLDVEAVRESLKTSVITGAFRRNDATAAMEWHYTGSFYAFRNAEVFARNWEPEWHGPADHYVEAWPSLIAEKSRANCLAFDGVGNLYDHRAWRQTSAKAPPVVRPIAPVAVCAISHNYGHYLAECVRSVEQSTVRPAEIIIVDDASDDNTEEVGKSMGYPYIRHDARNVHESRKLGYQNTTAKYLCFLDADDKLLPDYLANAVNIMEADGSIGIVFSDLQEFGDSRELRRHDPGAEIERANNYHAGSVVRRAALESSGALRDQFAAGQSWLDWIVWRQVVRAGWKTAKNPTPYLYRRHSRSMSVANRGCAYWDYAQLAREHVAIIIPLSGRPNSVKRLIGWLRGQTWPHEQCRLLLADTVAGGRLGWQIAQWISADYPNIRVQSLPIGRPGLADDDRVRCSREVQSAMAELYAKLRMMTDTEYNLIIEDDVLPPCDAIEKLLRGMDHSVAAVTGVGWSRFAQWYVAWIRDGLRHLTTLGKGIETIDGCWFGCTLIRRSALLAAPMTTDGRSGNFDYAFFDWLAAHSWECRINWDVLCDHAGLMADEPWRPRQ